MKTFLGTILESFTIQSTDRIIIVDADCSSSVKYGDYVEIVHASGKSLKVQVLDGILDDGSKFNAKSEKVSAIRVKNEGFVDNEIRESKVYLV